jgi:hypothetical protein
VKPEQWLQIRNLGKRGLQELNDTMVHLGLEMQLPYNHPATEKVVHNENQAVTDNTPKMQEIRTDEDTGTKTEIVEERVNPRKVPLEDLDFTAAAKLALMRKGVSSGGDLERLTPFDWYQIKKELGSTLQIERKMQELGLRIKK